MKIYPAKKSLFFNVFLIASALLPVIIISSDAKGLMDNTWAIIPTLLPFLLLFWIRIDTYYRLDNRYFYYRSAFIKGQIEVSKIRELIVGETMWTGLKPAMASKGIIIKYNSADEIYIAPINNTVVVEDLLALNPSIRTS